MKPFVICLFLVVSTSLVYAEVQLNLKDGRTLTWSEYTEEGGSYCTWKAGGQICIPKKDIVSIKEMEEHFPGATVIAPQPRSAEEKEREERDRNNLARERAEDAACDQMAQEIHSLSGRGIVSSMYAIAQAKLYQCRCIDKLKNCHLVSRGNAGGDTRGNAMERPMTMCPDGSYVSGRCRMTPRGTYVGD